PYADSRFVSFTDGRPARWPDPPTHSVTCCPGVRPKELLARLLSERPAEGIQATPPDQFLMTYMRARTQAMLWMMERGGPTDAEIRKHLTEFPIEAAMQTMVSMTRNQWQSAMSAALQDQLRHQFVALFGEKDPNGEPWAERLVAVHDQMTAAEV